MSAAISAGLKKKIEDVMAHYPKKEAALLPVLHLLQGERGFISADEEKEVATILGLKPIEVREVVTFYTMIHRRPIGKYHLQVCSNLSCSIAGGEKIIHFLKDKLGIEIGETTPDGKYTLSEVECLGACEQAPCMMVNFDYFGGLDREKIDAILGGLD